MTAFELCALAAGFVAVPAVIFDDLRAFVGDVPGHSGQKIHSGEDFKIPPRGLVHAGMVNHPAILRQICHFLHGERMAEDVLREVFEFGTVRARHGLAPEQVETTVTQS